MTRKFQKTFYEDDEVGLTLDWIDNLIWNHTYTTEPAKPFEVETRLSNKIKITIEIFDEEKAF